MLFEQQEDRLRVSATDLEISIVQEVTVSFDEDEGSKKRRIAVPAKRLLDTLRALPDLPIHFSCDADHNIELTTDKGKYKMVGFDGADYPAIPSLDETKVLSVAGPVIQRAIAKTGFAASKDALRPGMMGIFFQIGENEGRAVATDGHRLVRLTTSALTSSDPLNFIVPVKALTLAGRVAPEDECKVSVGDGYVGFDLGETRVLARIIDEPYPNYEAVIPVENDRRLSVSREALLAAVKRVALYSSSMTHQVRLSLSEGQVQISAEDIERASEARESVIAEYDSEPMEIGFNALYLSDVLNNIDGEDVIFEFSSPNRAGVVSPIAQREEEDILMLIMPVMLNTYA
jgi:DNA polymerase-3 subunit beta